MTVLSKFDFDLGAIRQEHLILCLRTIGAIIILQVVLGVAYNLLFHPLKKFPGPKLAAATNLYFYYRVLRGEESSWLCECHEKYGEVVRVGPGKLSYIAPQAWKDIAGHRTGGRQEFLKDPKFYRRDTNGDYHIVAEPDTETHGLVRRVFANAFSDKALKLQEPLISLHVNKLKKFIDKNLSEDPETPMNLVTLLNCTTFDIMGDLTFGESLGMLDTGKYTQWVKGVFEGIKVNSLFRLAQQYPVLDFFMKALMPPPIRGKDVEHFRHSSDRVDKRLEKGIDIGKSDIWKLVLQNQKVKLPLSKMHSNASAFMVAGTETTATLLSGLTYLLLTHPDKLKKVVEEVRALPKEDLRLEVLPRLQYLSVCFQEALRCYPPVPIGLPRVVPQGGSMICGEWIPEKTTVAVSQKAAYSSSLNFKDAKDFVPERWLPGSGYDTDRKEVLQPFSFGPRSCLGKNLAFHEMRLIAAMILWHYDLELCPESKTWIDQKAYIVYEKPELMVKLRPVQR
ncbi:hypothetical protein COCC4DRAFT_76610 [Bipolaris maydis ATCC 48331]|uniref:Cytochrome P450 monooxygenase n=2 Tax=Cochliobolus heterostrophus TaxID=5016 RepID=M2UJ54_COCH5|nr:uncharacterized protein COCC4DRAFT_76610 [Bipolaris maydis ATCC 48331]EMD93701.1 hypothetical protein COCHEDRAFT_1192981 [Bipolaris maydis C5]KAJ5027991.1 cytochrome P450 [Bipolaris maydis]ENH99275.1 hypothetical protein COCC4DRAFT_76610 [Bipolaris maydis ATCC 48331]KAJ6199028.1 cytochrome P450 [Bipolaris maydis]KAJ6204933.1 cytochrome P450 [Bipolaris maydis]